MLMIVCPCPLYLKVGFAGYKNPCFSFSLPLSQSPLSLSLKWEMDLEWTAFYIQVLGKEGVKTVATPSVKNQCRFLTGSVSTAVHCFLFSTSLLLNIPLPWFYQGINFPASFSFPGIYFSGRRKHGKARSTVLHFTRRSHYTQNELRSFELWEENSPHSSSNLKHCMYLIISVLSWIQRMFKRYLFHIPLFSIKEKKI